MEQSSFFNSVNDDRLYDDEIFALYFRQFLSTGVYHTDNAPTLRPKILTGLQVELDPGSAFIQGYMYSNTTPIIFNHAVGDNTNPRIDRIVIRLDRNVANRYVKAFIKKGTPATNPLPPVLQRDSVVYEISVAQVRVNAGANTILSLTDERYDKTVAGLVTSLITIPTEQFKLQWDEWFKNTLIFKKQWDDWFNSRQNEIGVKVTSGSVEPVLANVGPGDIWLKRL